MAQSDGYDMEVGRWGRRPGNDRASLEAAQKEQYWECECGLVRRGAKVIADHCLEHSHDAVFLTDNGKTVRGRLVFSEG